jgi:AcrR family transcriptional regulator
VTKSALEKAREAPGSTKARILAAAEEVFASRGFEGASTREIAARAGVNISSLHYHWASKETLYLAVFRNIFDQLVELLQDTLRPLETQHRERALDGTSIIDQVMTRLFDFFNENPNVPKLLVRRIVENTDIEVGVQRDVLVPAWSAFSEWLTRLGRKMSDTQSRLFMLSVHSVMLIYLLDSQSYQSLLGGSVRSGPLRDEVRAHVTHLVHALLAP